MPIPALRVATFAAVCALGIGPLSGPAEAQNTTGTITGLVLDEQNLAVPGATIAVEDANRGFTRTTTSAEDGTFEVPGLRPESSG